MPRGILPLLLAALLLVAPTASSAEAFQFESPAPRQPIVPQLFCAIVYDEPGAQRCDVVGPLSRATDLSIVMGGTAGTARVQLVDKQAPITRQIAFVECARNLCEAAFAPQLTTHAELYIYSSGAAGHTVSVSVHKDAQEGLSSL